MGSSSVKVIIAAHKQCELPRDEIYLPVFVGAALKRSGALEASEALETSEASEASVIPEGFTPDDTGENISVKNPYYCELTGLYWAWKNLCDDYIGLVHYRRFLGRRGSKKDPYAGVLTKKLWDKELAANPDIKVIVPQKRNYYIETLGSHYAHTHDATHLVTTRAIIAEQQPDYLRSFDRVIKQRSGHMFNMMIMERGTLDNYCSWLFPILDELVKRTDISGLSAFDARFPGRIAEILLNVWLDFNADIGIISRRSIVSMNFFEAGRVNWLKKGTSFLSAKFTGKRYKGSF